MINLKVKKIINTTPHGVNLLNEEGKEILALPPAEKPARAIVENERVGVVQVDGVEIPLNGFSVKGGTENLPEPQEGVIYIVSLLVCRANPDRGDLFVVDELVRDDQGRVIGAKALSQNPYFKGKKLDKMNKTL